MARLQSMASGGAWATPEPLLASIAALVAPPKSGVISLLDPCAAKGDAILSLAKLILTKAPDIAYASVYACELEDERGRALLHTAQALNQTRVEWHGKIHLDALHGDAFAVKWETAFTGRWGGDNSEYDHKRGASLTFSNPPFERGKLEARFLDRFTLATAKGGVLLYIVPYTALALSADILAQHYDVAGCYRFPEPYWSGPEYHFRQVVLVATRRAALKLPDPRTRDMVIGWSRDADAIPVLPEAGPPIVALPEHETGTTGFTDWKLQTLDVDGLLARVEAWRTTNQRGEMIPITSAEPPRSAEEVLVKRFDVLMPLKPAHLIAAVAAGGLRGAVLSPDDPSSGLPPLLANGVYQRMFTPIDERKDNKGKTKAVELREHGKLMITVLDLSARPGDPAFTTLRDDAEVTGAKRVADMTTGDFFASYQTSIATVMRERCPVRHDPGNPAHEISLPDLATPLWGAQRQVVMATYKGLGGDAPPPPTRGWGKRRARLAYRRRWHRKGVYTSGQMGTGKSRMATALMKAMGAEIAKREAHRTVLFIPPHLLTGWPKQIAAVVPEARVHVLDSMEAVDAMFADNAPGYVVGLLTQTKAKLSHAWRGIEATARGYHCPKCNAPAPKPKSDHRDPRDYLASSRAVCAAKPRAPLDAWARLAREVALLLYPSHPTIESEQAIASFDMGTEKEPRPTLTPHELRIFKAAEARTGAGLDAPTEAHLAARREAWARAVPRAVAILDRMVAKRIAKKKDWNERSSLLDTLIVALLVAIGDRARVIDLATRFHESVAADREPHGFGAFLRRLVRRILLLVPGADTDALAERLEEEGPADSYSTGGGSYFIRAGYHVPWQDWKKMRDTLAQGQKWSDEFRGVDGAALWYGHAFGDGAALVRGLAALVEAGVWRSGEPCGERLYYASAEPDRFPLARYIHKRYGRRLHALFVDEAHEEANGDSAQGRAARLLGFLGVPVVLLTGTTSNGKAESMFHNHWLIDRDFRHRYRHDDESTFVRENGYVTVLEEDKVDGKPVEYGSNSDRVVRGRRQIDTAPGVMPGFILGEFLQRAATIHLADLDIDLPQCREISVPVQASDDIAIRYAKLEKKLLKQLKADKRIDEKRGKLLGALAEFLPSYADLMTADVGNQPDGGFRVHYPDKPDLGVYRGQLVYPDPLDLEKGEDPAILEPLHAGVILPKEQWMLDTVKAELAEGRPCMLLVRHTRLAPRLVRLLKAAKVKVVHLDASRVQTHEREPWIDREVVEKGAEVLVCNPITIQTGINNLVYFATEIWFENPAVNAQVYDQARARIHRPGQTRPTRCYFPFYTLGASAAAKKLLFTKVAEMRAVEGLDPVAALAAAGVGQADMAAAMAVGRALYRMLAGESLDLDPAPIARAAPATKPRGRTRRSA